MFNSFIIVLREGFEAFLIVAIIFAYLRKTGRSNLLGSVYTAIGVSIAASAGIGYWLYQVSTGGESANQALIEGILGLVAIVLVGSLIIHMRRIGPKLKQTMHAKLETATEGRTSFMAALGVFLFTLLMITREGMETALLLLNVKEQSDLLIGGILGLIAATVLAFAWGKFGHLINMARFFQVTSLFLFLFLIQIAIYTFHEFSEADIFPNSEYWHAATEIWGPDGKYGEWFSSSIVIACIGWLGFAYISDKRSKTAINQ